MTKPKLFVAPKTLDEAIMNALCVGVLKDCPERIYQHVRDFLAQKFGTSIVASDLRLDINNSERLKRLFDEIVIRENKP